MFHLMTFFFISTAVYKFELGGVHYSLANFAVVHIWPIKLLYIKPQSNTTNFLVCAQCMKHSTHHRMYFEQTYLKFYMTHDPCIIRIYTIIIPTNAHKYFKISLYIQ